MLMFRRVERYYADVGEQLGLGEIPARPVLEAGGGAMHVVVPVASVSRLTRLALETAAELGGTIHPVAVSVDQAVFDELSARWARWAPGVDLQVLPSPHRSLVDPVVGYVRGLLDEGLPVTVLIATVEPRHRRQEILHNQRGLLLAAALRARTDAVVATLPYRLT
jgi:hypothetical protein